MKKKLALFFTAILAMACVLSGCGGKDKKTSGKENRSYPDDRKRRIQ